MTDTSAETVARLIEQADTLAIFASGYRDAKGARMAPFYEDVGAALRALAAALEQRDAEIARLREALQEAVLQIEYMHGKFQATATGNAVLARVRAALAGEATDGQ